MRPSTRAAITAGSVVLVATVALVIRTLMAGGVFSDVTPGFAGTCATLSGIVGAEDLQIDEADRLVFVAATDRLAPPGHPARQDGLYTMPLDHPAAGFTKLAGTPSDFHPHGLSLYRGADGKLTLMAVNHEAAGDQAVEIFDVTVANGAAKLVPRGHIEGGALVSPNDLVAVGPEQFYVTNDHTSHSDLGKFIEGFALLPRANVAYFDGSVFRVAASGLLLANGINLSRDGRYVYVAQTSGRALKTFERIPYSGGLTEVGELAIPAGPDNIDVAPDGSLWLAGHPNLFAAMASSKDPAKRAASEIFRVETVDGMPRAARLVYANEGGAISGASVGAVSGRHLFIGSVLDNKVLDCTFEK